MYTHYLIIRQQTKKNREKPKRITQPPPTDTNSNARKPKKKIRKTRTGVLVGIGSGPTTCCAGGGGRGRAARGEGPARQSGVERRALRTSARAPSPRDSARSSCPREVCPPVCPRPSDNLGRRVSVPPPPHPDHSAVLLFVSVRGFLGRCGRRPGPSVLRLWSRSSHCGRSPAPLAPCSKVNHVELCARGTLPRFFGFRYLIWCSSRIFKMADRTCVWVCTRMSYLDAFVPEFRIWSFPPTVAPTPFVVSFYKSIEYKTVPF